ncbi:MAG: hypothetical protein JWO05_1004 [Gemmatimonadetes bacterium]|nr:hypothetical protein [Gemmatimonadota bacterium]
MYVMKWIGWMGTLHRSDQALILGAILLFCVLAPASLQRGGRRALAALWLFVLAPLVVVGWRRWAISHSPESARLPLADIAFYVLPVGGALALATIALVWAAGQGRSRTVQHVATLVSAYAPLPIVFAVSAWLVLDIYMVTGGFI